MPWPVLPDALSGVRIGNGAADLAAHYDQLLLSPRFREVFNPDTIFHIGGAITSKRLNEFIAERRPKYVHVASHGLRKDPGHIVTHRVECDLTTFCGWLTAWVRGRGSKDLLAPLLNLSKLAGATIDAWLDDSPDLTEMHVARIVSRMAPAGSTLFAGNSMPVRDLDMFSATDSAVDRILANRGASGIDGNLATALGVATALHRPITAIVGDLTALHDLNSLALLKCVNVPVVIVVINNDGGGIFNFLPIHQHAPAEYEHFFGTPHGLGFAQAASMFGAAYAVPGSATEFREAYTRATATPGATLIEVRTQRAANLTAHRALQQHVAATVDAAIAAHQG